MDPWNELGHIRENVTPILSTVTENDQGTDLAVIMYNFEALQNFGTGTE